MMIESMLLQLQMSRSFRLWHVLKTSDLVLKGRDRSDGSVQSENQYTEKAKTNFVDYNMLGNADKTETFVQS